MHLDVLRQVVAARELLLAHGALVGLHARVRAPVPGQLVRAREPVGQGGERPHLGSPGPERSGSAVPPPAPPPLPLRPLQGGESSRQQACARAGA